VRFAFRVDSSATIGTGHVRRCLALAEALRRRGTTSTFICQPLTGNINAEIETSGHSVLELPHGDQGTVRSGAQANLEAVDIVESQKLLESAGAIDCIIVDHYQLGTRWEAMAAKLASRCAVIDDLGRPHHQVDLLIDPTPGDERSRLYDGILPDSSLVLLGTRYALLRVEFAELRRLVAPRSGPVRRVLINFGGTSTTQLCISALQVVRSVLGRSVAADIVVGGHDQDLAELHKAADGDPSVFVHVNTPEMARLMMAADLAIGAGGTSSWERACLGLPAMITEIAANQAAVVSAIVDAGAGMVVSKDQDYAEALSLALAALQKFPARLNEMSRNAVALVDGKGAERVAAILLRPVIQLRRAEAADSRRVWEWRNEPHVREVSHNPAPIPWEGHCRWFESVLVDTGRDLLICEAGGEAVGVLRFDVTGQEAAISVYLNREGRGKGIGPDLLRAGERWLRAKRPSIRTIAAEILDGNVASQAAFAAARYHAIGGQYIRELSHHESA
jgi:UDP-2,4-diacetamido-2,4,6-trideoxy-beta-L-altropyranose hydrolase